MRPRPRALATILGATAAMLGLVGPAAASTRHVDPGESIQAAIDAADEGDTIAIRAGVYRENLTITKDGITLRGAGDEDTILMPAATPVESVCSDPEDPSFVNGVCVLGDFNFETGEAGPPVEDTRIRNLVIDGFPAFGVFALNAEDLTVEDTVARNNAGYGISGFVLKDVSFLDNEATDNGEPGFYIGDSPEADAEVVGNEALRNGVGSGEGFGIFLRDASHGVVRDNEVEGNCVGILLLDTGEPGPTSDWTVKDNEVDANNGACPAGEEGPATSGTGIALAGTHDVTVTDNEVEDHAPALESPFSGGIAVFSTVEFGGAEPTDNRVSDNTVRDNEPADIVYDGSGSGNEFDDNRCDTSQPEDLCG